MTTHAEHAERLAEELLGSMNLLSEGTLRELQEAILEALDVRLGNCSTCHGDGRFPGDEQYPCEDCGGSGNRVDELGTERLKQAGYHVTSSVQATDPPLVTWLVYRPDDKPLEDHFPTEDAAWNAAKRDHDEWGSEEED